MKNVSLKIYYYKYYVTLRYVILKKKTIMIIITEVTLKLLYANNCICKM